MIHPDLPKLAISVRQPWVWAIFYAGKPVENRDWSTKFRGSVCIHASKGMTLDEFEDAGWTFASCGVAVGPAFGELPRGGIVGIVDIIDCVTESDSPWFFGKYGFVLANARPVEFIPVKGALGFFDWRKNLVAA